MEAKLRIQTRSGTWFECDATNHEDAIKTLSMWGEMLTEPDCGRCGCKDLIPKHRRAQQYDYYHLECRNPECGAQLAFGQLREGGGVFPKRKDQNDNWLPHRGWYHWKERQQQRQQQSSQDTYSEPVYQQSPPVDQSDNPF